MKPPDVVIRFTADTSRVAQAARVIAHHLEALAEDLDRLNAPDTVISFPSELTEEQVAEIQERFKSQARTAAPHIAAAAWRAGYGQGRDDEASGLPLREGPP